MERINAGRNRAQRSWLAAVCWAVLGAPMFAPMSTSAASAAGAAAASSADSERIAALERQYAESLQLIKDLSGRVKQLESQLADQHVAAGNAVAGSAVPGSAVAGSSVAGSAPVSRDDANRLDAVERTVNEMSANIGKQESGLPLHGFADVGVGSRNPIFPEYKGVDIGSLEFYLAPRFSGRTRGLFEMTFEVGADGGVSVDLERAQIGFQPSDSLTVWAGRFHTPYGYYNTAFHHGQQIATSLRRPRFIEFEDHGGVMPAHTVGLWLTGNRRNDAGRWSFDAFLGNAQSIRGGELDMNNAGGKDGAVMVGGNVGWQPAGALEGLHLGLDAFQARVTDYDQLASPQVRLRSVGIYSAYDSDRWEGLGEWHSFDNQLVAGGASHRSNAGFLQLGYRAGRLTPYARLERGNFSQDDLYFAAQQSGSSYDRNAIGLRFDVDVESAIKMELSHTRFRDRQQGSIDEALMRYAIRF